MKKNSNKIKAQQRLRLFQKKVKCEDTFGDDTAGSGKPSKMLPAVASKMSREIVVTGKKSTVKETKTASREISSMNVAAEKKKNASGKKVAKTGSAECSKYFVEKLDKEVPTGKIVQAAKTFSNYLLDMKESSANTYFDTHLAKYAPSNETTTAWEKNVSKNRSKTHKVYDSSRVKLVPTESSKGNDYINASLIKFDNIETEFIMTQYPLPDTAVDFWTMISEKQIDRIITVYEPCVDDAIEEFSKIPDTTALAANESTSQITQMTQTKSQLQLMIERSSRRCDFDEIKSLHPLFADNYMNLKGWLINTRKVEPDERNKSWQTTYVVEVLPEGCSDATFVRIFNCCSWPWKKVPSDERKLLALVRCPWKGIIPKPGKPEPIVVACDLGLDRSATIVLTTVLIEMVLAGKAPDCDALFKKMRDQRAGCFTMSIFYTYALRAALFYVRIRLKAMSDVEEDVIRKIDAALAKLPFNSSSKR
uniref:Protein-tyrosine-phosphatase n=1 Tax=Caenorhabditis japonica TaxID=281687 RepID=A0A8R1HLD5_CAEJA